MKILAGLCYNIVRLCDLTIRYVFKWLAYLLQDSVIAFHHGLGTFWTLAYNNCCFRVSIVEYQMRRVLDLRQRSKICCAISGLITRWLR